MSDLSIKVVWFPKNVHAEISIGNKIHYFIGQQDRYRHQRNLSVSITNSSRTPVVLFAFKSSLNTQAVYAKIEKTPPSKLNTCMGSVAVIAEQISSIVIPTFVRQSPELSAFYLMGRYYVAGDVSFETYGISKRVAILKAMMVGSVQLGICVFSVYQSLKSTWNLLAGDPMQNNII